MQSSLDWIKYDTGSKDNLLDESGFLPNVSKWVTNWDEMFFF